MEFRDFYFETLNINPHLEKEKVKAALDRAYQQRSFEIEHYWKRATYFWGYQIVIFATFGLVWKEQTAEGGRLLLIALALIGSLTALANVLSAEGSKFWHQNWENHIDMLEDGVEGKLYKAVWLERGDISFSVSKINRSLNLCFFVFWGGTLVYATWRFFVAQGVMAKPSSVGIEWILLLFFACVVGVSALWRRTTIRGSLTDSDGRREKLWRRSAAFKPQSLVGRFSPNVENLPSDN